METYILTLTMLQYLGQDRLYSSQKVIQLHSVLEGTLEMI